MNKEFTKNMMTDQELKEIKGGFLPALMFVAGSMVGYAVGCSGRAS